MKTWLVIKRTLSTGREVYLTAADKPRLGKWTTDRESAEVFTAEEAAVDTATFLRWPATHHTPLYEVFAAEAS